MLNMAIGMTPLRNDQMDALEIDALAKALDEEAKKSATFAKYLDAALGMTGAGGIWGVLGLMAMRRAARHGILPSMFDGQAAMLLQMAAQSNEAPVIRATAPETAPIVDASTE